MFLRHEENEYGTGTTWFKCNTCTKEYSVTPQIEDVESNDWNHCLHESCSSYDPHRDAEILFMTNEEISKEKKIVSINKLRQRRK